jgi:hypothetical protein
LVEAVSVLHEEVEVGELLELADGLEGHLHVKNSARSGQFTLNA